jgi:ubiquinol-cytochrome c reductase cytochrome b subunit
MSIFWLDTTSIYNDSLYRQWIVEMLYVLPYGQMSLWGATVITNLLSAIPYVGTDFVQLVWGGFSVSNATLNRFFSLHYLLPFILAALALMHMITIHQHGSSNPNGVTGNVDRVSMHPYFVFKDLVTIFLFFLALSVIIFYYPNLMGHSDNYIPANPMSTPASIVPEWYLLPYYAILRSIPNKLFGVIAMFASLFILLIMPIVDNSKVRSGQFRPLFKVFFWIFVMNFFLLLWLGSQHPEYPFTVIGQISTVVYFSFFLVFVPVISVCENTLLDINNKLAVKSANS